MQQACVPCLNGACQTCVPLLPLPRPCCRACLATQAAVAAICIAASENKRQLSAQLCSWSMARYQAASEAINLLASCAVPLANGALRQRLEGALAFHPASLFLHLTLTFCLPVVLLYRAEWRQRLAFARRRRLAAEEAGLQERQEQWGAAALLVFVLGAAPWLSVQLCHAGLRLGWIPAR